MRVDRGFTLVELIMVLVLLGIVAVFVIPRTPGKSIEARAQADQLASDIRYVQSLSMTHGERYRINFNVAGNSYQLATQVGVAVAHPATGTTAPIALRGGVAFQSTTNSLLVFDGKGTPYSDAATPGTPLAANAVITLRADSDTRTVTVSPETGRVIVQ
jgi:MSHA pilin protein MshC